MQFKLKDTHRVFSKAFTAWKDKDQFRKSAVIAYYAIFSIPGLLLLIISIAGYFFGRDAVNQNLLAQISSTMGTDIAKATVPAMVDPNLYCISTTFKII